MQTLPVRALHYPDHLIQELNALRRTMKKTNALLLSFLLAAMSLAGCFGGEDDGPISGCTDSDAVNYDSSADDDDDSCVMAAPQSELEIAALAQMLALDQSRADGESYGIETIVKTDVEIEGDSMVTEITTIEIFDAENDAMRYTYSYEMDGMQMAYYEVRQKGDIINVNSEDEWYNLNDELDNVSELFDALILQGVGDDITMGPYFTCDDGSEVQLEWVNDGMEDCSDGTDEGVSQEDIDEIMATGRLSPLFFDEQEFAEFDWSMTVANGYQTIFATVDNETYYINFDSELKMISLVAKSTTSADALGVGFENVESKISIIDVDAKTVSDDYSPAASPFLVETNYDASKYLWECELSHNIPADQVITEDEINSSIESTPTFDLPEWCDDKYPSSEMIHTFGDNEGDEYFWNDGFSTTKRVGGWNSDSPIFHYLRIEGSTLITTSLNASEHISAFYCDEGTTTISFVAINDGVVDCSSGIDEDTQTGNDYLECTNLGFSTIAVYVESTDSCETTTNLSQVKMDEEYLYFVLSETLELWDHGDRNEEPGTEFWFKRSQGDGLDAGQSIIGESYFCNSCDYNGMSPYSFIIEDEMNFQNDLGEFRMDLGFVETNDDGEEEFTLHVSFDLSQMQSGESTDSSGKNWAFNYYDMNGNDYLDAGDTIVVYTDYADGWGERPTVKLYHGWGEGYTDESPALLPGFTTLSTLFLLVVAALNRRNE